MPSLNTIQAKHFKLAYLYLKDNIDDIKERWAPQLNSTEFTVRVKFAVELHPLEIWDYIIIRSFLQKTSRIR